MTVSLSEMAPEGGEGTLKVMPLVPGGPPPVKMVMPAEVALQSYCVAPEAADALYVRFCDTLIGVVMAGASATTLKVSVCVSVSLSAFFTTQVAEAAVLLTVKVAVRVAAPAVMVIPDPVHVYVE